jgi:hypothetical protein
MSQSSEAYLEQNLDAEFEEAMEYERGLQSKLIEVRPVQYKRDVKGLINFILWGNPEGNLK